MPGGNFNTTTTTLPLLLVVLSIAVLPIHAFVLKQATVLTSTRTVGSRTATNIRQRTAFIALSALPPQHKGESSQQYFERLTQAAANPDTFAQMALEQTTTTTSASSQNGNENKPSVVSTDHPNDSPPPRYVPVEEWDAAQRNQTKGGLLSWEERVQFDGQRHGNRFRQNEILRHNLKGF